MHPRQAQSPVLNPIPLGNGLPFPGFVMQNDKCTRINFNL